MSLISIPMTTPLELPTSALVKEWIDSTNFDDLELPNIGFAQQFFDACIRVFFAIWPKIKSNDAFEPHQIHTLREILGNLHLFRVGFQEDTLTCALSQSDKLQNSVLETTYDISQVILQSTVFSLNTMPRFSKRLHIHKLNFGSLYFS